MDDEVPAIRPGCPKGEPVRLKHRDEQLALTLIAISLQVLDQVGVQFAADCRVVTSPHAAGGAAGPTENGTVVGVSSDGPVISK